jgi:hypothetical protein
MSTILDLSFDQPRQRQSWTTSTASASSTCGTDLRSINIYSSRNSRKSLQPKFLKAQYHKLLNWWQDDKHVRVLHVQVYLHDWCQRERVQKQQQQ